MIERKLICTAEGVSWLDASSSIRTGSAAESAPGFRWSQVSAVTAFKRDLLTVDLLCIAFVLEEGTSLEANEEMDGWSALMDSLPVHLSGVPVYRDWALQVLQPPFARNETVLFERAVVIGVENGGC